jgi:hypothetical protein
MQRPEPILTDDGLGFFRAFLIGGPIGILMWGSAILVGRALMGAG